MSESASDVVTRFLEAVQRKELDAAMELATEDLEYHNIPMDKLEGAAAAREFLEGFLAGAEGLEWIVHHQVAHGDLVMNERNDRFQMGGRWLDLPVVGVFELRDGKIARWRDYFDVQMFTSQMEAPSG